MRKLVLRGDDAGVERGEAAGEAELPRTPVRSSVRKRSFSRFRRARSCSNAVTCRTSERGQRPSEAASALDRRAQRCRPHAHLSAHAMKNELLLCLELVLQGGEALLQP